MRAINHSVAGTLSRRAALQGGGVIATLIALGQPASGLAQASPVASRQSANSYRLSGEGIEVVYASTSFNGQPTLSFRSDGIELDLRGDQIAIETTHMLGELVSIMIDSVQDAYSDNFTVLLPPINLPDGAGSEVRFSTLGVRTRHHTTVGGPGMVDGAIITYEALVLEGVAELLFF